MNAQPATARRRIGIALLAACSVLLTSCAAGKHAATARQTPPIDGNNGSVGAIELHAVAVVSPPGGVTYQKGSDAALSLVLVNTGTADDTLTDVSTPAASSWAIFDNGALSGTSSSASSSVSATASPTGSASTPAGATSLALPAGQSLSFGVGNGPQSLLLVNLAQTVYAAQTLQIKFTFAKAGSVTLAVPVQVSTTPGSSTVPAGSAAAD